MLYIGIDIGSVAVKAVVIDESVEIIERRYLRHLGNPTSKTLEVLKEIKNKYPEASISITGTASTIISDALDLKPVNEVVAQGYSTRKLFPHIKTIIEMGGEDSKLIVLEGGMIKEFSMNSVCAAGTGSFLEQQAERLNLSIEEFGRIAEKSKRPSKIAGRCSVFAKSDMIHLQQIATPLEDIVSGLCFAVARNFKGSIARGIYMKPPLSFQGGVAANTGMVRAFREVFGIPDIFIPPDFYFMGAIGAVLKNMDEGHTDAFEVEKQIGKLEDFISSRIYNEKGYAPLGYDDFFERQLEWLQRPQTVNPVRNLLPNTTAVAQRQPISDRINSDTGKNGRRRAYLGIDVGSISTNLALIDENGKLIAKRYLMTAGRPIEAVKKGLEEIYLEAGESVSVCGVGTTGSGRYMIADYVGADIVKNEITAQACAAIFIDPSVDTIFEIGGQDSKYISVMNGTVVDFEMNKACAAGTGSFLEEQAEKLGISVKDEFATSAFTSGNPCPLGERCTVFMENSLMANLQRGAKIDDLLAGLCYSIAQNYINRVVAGKPIQKNIFFQGGVAFNNAVVAAFEKYLGKKITVPPDHDVTGAIGMALIAKENMKNDDSTFKGLDLFKKSYEISSFECGSCPNLCEINRVSIEGEQKDLFYGGRCEKYDMKQTKKHTLPDLFAFREDMLWKEHNHRASAYAQRIVKKTTAIRRIADTSSADREGRRQKYIAKIGIPYIFYFQDFLPFWSVFLWELGFEVVISPKTNKSIINLGLESIFSEACFPVKVAHGHIKHLKDVGVDFIFLPSFITLNGDDTGFGCPYIQTIPYVSKVALGDMNPVRSGQCMSRTVLATTRRATSNEPNVLSPILDFIRGENYIIKELCMVFRNYASKSDIKRAFSTATSAQEEFKKAIREKGKEIIDGIRIGDKVIVIVGRSYNAFDPGVNLDIPKKLSGLETISIPMDFLPLEEDTLEPNYNMYWFSGRKLLKAARFIKKNPRLYPIYIGNFSCGPDSFILKYFKKELGEKPFLHIEIDEHSATAGAITRCEAFLDSIGNKVLSATGETNFKVQSNKPSKCSVSVANRIIYIPRMSDHAFSVKAAFEYCGVNAEVLPESDRESVEIGKKYVSGKECYPYLVTTGDMLKKVFSKDFIPEKSAFFMPSGSGPCRFGQYNISHRFLLENLGFKNVLVFSPNQDEQLYKSLGIVDSSFALRAWKGMVAVEILIKSLHETRPYEKNSGDSENLYDFYLKKIYECLLANGSIEELLRKMKAHFSSAVSDKIEKKPVIGIVGEIFVRSHRFSNEDIIRKIESLGGEAWLSPMPELIYYLNKMSVRRAIAKRSWRDFIETSLKDYYQKKIEKKFGKSFKGFLKSLEEPSVAEVFEKSSPYLDDSFEGEAILSIGKTIDFIEKGASGIINIMPFGCMPGTIVTALLKAVSKEHGVPCISIPYDGTESTHVKLQIEAFIEATKTAPKL